MRFRALFIAATASGGLLVGCAIRGQPVREVGLNRLTPHATFDYLKAMAAANQVEAEWSTFSPGFKRRLSEQVGRNVDVGDYAQARATIASNSTKEMRLLLDAEFVGEKQLSDEVAMVTIRSGGRQATPRFIRMTAWRLKIRGEGDPVSEFVPSASDAVSMAPDGSFSVRVAPSGGTAAYLREIPANRIESFEMTPLWYLDDFGGVESAVAGGLRNPSARAALTSPAPASSRPGARPTLPGPRPVAPPPPQSAPTPSPGSPDPGSPDGPGSPG